MRKLFLIMMTLIAVSLGLKAQSVTYHGTVLDAASNEPLIGATVMPVGGGQGAACDIDGNFTITVPAKVKKATVSYVGYTSKTVDLSNKMVVYLNASSASLDEVVVVAYGTQTKESLTGSVAVVGSKEIESRPVTSVTSALEGNAPGVQVNNTVGAPGSSPTIRIRGFNSINGSNAPLYVVDGIPFDGTIVDLNPADIESMSVLKDAASAALYGNRGANGVILITTKKAKNNGKVDVTLQVRQGMYTRGIPEYDRLNANEWMQTAFDAVVNGGVSSGVYATRQEAIDFYRGSFIDGYAKNNIYGVPNDQLYNAEGVFAPYRYQTDAEGTLITDAEGNPVAERVYNPLAAYTDLHWWDAVSNGAGYRQEYNVNAAGATDKFNVFASVGYLKENGYTINSDFERYNARINTNYNPTSYLRLGINLAATQQDSRALDLTSYGNVFQSQFMAPIFPYYAHDAEGNVIMENGEPKWNAASYLQNNNMAFLARHDKSNNNSTVVDGSAYGTIVLPYGFDFTVRGNMHRDKTNGWSYMNNLMGSALGFGLLQYSSAGINSYTFLQELNWSREYGVHHVDALLHHENQSYDETSSYAVAKDQEFPDIYNLSNFTNPSKIGGSIGEVRGESYLGRVRYNYMQRYFGEASFRRDGTSRFAPKNRWGNFWSVGASWVISKEKFMQDFTWVDYLKLRSAYGSVGNCISAGAYSYWSLYASHIPYSGLPTMIPAQLASDDVKWESTKTFDIALEGAVLNDRLGFSIGWFNKRNADLLFNVPKMPSAGAPGNTGGSPSILTNIGTMENYGWELSAYATVLRTPELEWRVSADATFLKNRVVSLPEHKMMDLGSYIREEGRSIYEFYLYPWAGVDQLTGQSLYEMDPSSYDYFSYDANNKLVFDQDKYDSKVKNAQDDGSLVVINGKNYTYKTEHAGRVISGTSLPTVYGSFGTNLGWKGLNASVLFTYGLGGKTNDSNYASLMSYGDAPGALHRDVLKAWTEAPEGMTADSPNRIDPNGTPQANTYTSLWNNGQSSRYLISSDYLVFKNLAVSYDLPLQWVRPLEVQNINLGVSVDNLFSLSKRTGMNPQMNFDGGQGAGYVTARVISFQLGVKF